MKLDIAFGLSTCVIVLTALLGACGRLDESVSVSKNFQIGSRAGIAANDIEGWELYVNDKVGFRLNYPSDWRLARDEARAIDRIIAPGGANEKDITIMVIESSFEIALRDEFIEEVILSDGVTAKLLHDNSPRDESPLDRLIVEIDGNVFIEANGYGRVFDRVIKSFRLTN